jgi:hypothetical protein
MLNTRFTNPSPVDFIGEKETFKKITRGRSENEKGRISGDAA